MGNDLLYIFIAVITLNVLVNMFMIYHICDKIELINKEVHSSNNYVLEKVIEKDLKKVGK